MPNIHDYTSKGFVDEFGVYRHGKRGVVLEQNRAVIGEYKVIGPERRRHMRVLLYQCECCGAIRPAWSDVDYIIEWNTKNPDILRHGFRKYCPWCSYSNQYGYTGTPFWRRLTYHEAMTARLLGEVSGELLGATDYIRLMREGRLPECILETSHADKT